jgi:hypothetical protein
MCCTGREDVPVRSIHLRVSDEMYMLMERHDARVRAETASRRRLGLDGAPTP